MVSFEAVSNAACARRREPGETARDKTALNLGVSPA
ncbi:hypothetical protein MMMDOFMJ_1228 [Methylobacterium gnaphalii]|nr:hypothetical protein MMMDOFMJ_1228 [Methylobacterium gnaphalii]